MSSPDLVELLELDELDQQIDELMTQMINETLGPQIKDADPDNAYRVCEKFRPLYRALLIEQPGTVLQATTEGEAVVDRRNPEVNQVIEQFTDLIGKQSRVKMQRRAAYTLVHRHGVEQTLEAIKYYDLNRDDRYCPSITSLEQLRDKWIQLENHARRTAARRSNEMKGMEVI